MNKALVGIMKFVVSDLSQEDVLFIKRNPELSNEESKWDINYKGIEMLFDEYHGELKTCKKFENPRKSKTEIGKEYLVNSNYKKMKKNKISRKEKIVNDISNYFFIYGYEEGINNYDNENKKYFLGFL